MCVLIDEPTDGVDVEEVHRCSEDGFEHAVVQRLCSPDQHVEQEHIPDESKNDDGQRQTSINAQVEVCVQLPGDVQTVLYDGAVGVQLVLLFGPDR